MILPLYPKPADHWDQALKVLVEWSQDYDRNSPRPWLHSPISPDGERDHPGQFRRLEAPVRAEIERAIESLLSEGKTEPLSTTAKYFLGVRIDVCIVFVSLLATNDGFLQPSSTNVQTILRWTLLDWWNKHGPRLVCLSFDESQD